jgi:uracil-DNA glycosylase
MTEEDLSTINSLKQLERVVNACPHCPLRETRTNVVFGVGDPHADLMFVGEAPGVNEDRQGEPFVGAAGRLLDELLDSVLGLSRKDVYISNVLKCRPPGNRDPRPEEVAHCRPFLDKQIELIDPKIICPLGNHATRAMLQRQVNISKLHGQPVKHGGRWVFPTYHPAAALYAGAVRKLLEEDFRKLGGLLAEKTGGDGGDI